MTTLTEPTLADRIRHALALIEVAVTEAKQKIGQQLDNPRIERRFENAKSAFVVDSKVLNDTSRWDVFFHDWTSQYRYAAELLEKRRFSALEKLLSGQSYSDSSHGTKAFAPEVIERVSAITGDLRHAISRLGGPATLNHDENAVTKPADRKSPKPFR